ncbi:hypothetical protein L1887_06155 [Cichorium endivia]|nr:hypothetical protein L1887_06154 [Cichorium endivia]KAI3526889.1 hypothetical protein L1887_06155 [Cichorium endivia]
MTINMGLRRFRLVVCMDSDLKIIFRLWLIVRAWSFVYRRKGMELAAAQRNGIEFHCVQKQSRSLSGKELSTENTWNGMGNSESNHQKLVVSILQKNPSPLPLNKNLIPVSDKVNTSHWRNGALVKQKFGEAVESHWLKWKNQQVFFDVNDQYDPQVCLGHVRRYTFKELSSSLELFCSSRDLPVTNTLCPNRVPSTWCVSSFHLSFPPTRA